MAWLPSVITALRGAQQHRDDHSVLHAFANSVFNVMDPTYGATGDGVTDDGPAIASAVVAALAVNGTVFLPPGHYRYGVMPFSILDRVNIVGSGYRTTILQPLSSYTDWAMQIDNCWRNGEEQIAATTIDFGVTKAGVIVRDLAIVGDRAFAANGIKTTRVVDNLLMENVFLGYLNGTALGLASEDTDGVLRESVFNRVITRACGSATEAGIELSAGATGGDNTNINYFNDIDVVYPHGIGWRIWNQQAGSELRHIRINNLLLHGWQANASAPAADVMSVEGKVTGLQMKNVTGNGSSSVSAVDYALIALESGTGGSPAEVEIDIDMRSCEGDGIRVGSCNQLKVQGTTQANTITGHEITFQANSTSLAWLDLLAFGTRDIDIDATVAAAVFGLVAVDNYHLPQDP